MNNKYSSRLLKAINDGKLGLTRSDFMQDDALTQHIRNIRKVGFVNKLKRTIEEIKNSDDEIGMNKKQRFKEIFKTEHSGSETEKQKKDSGVESDIQSIAPEAEITDDEIGDILDGGDKDDYNELISGLNQARDDLIMEDLSDTERIPRISKYNLCKTREIKVTPLIIDDAIKGVEDRKDKLEALIKKGEDEAKKQIELVNNKIKTTTSYGRRSKPTTKVREAATLNTEINAEKAIIKINDKLESIKKVKEHFKSLIQGEIPVTLPPPPPEEIPVTLPHSPPSEEIPVTLPHPPSEETEVKKTEIEPIPFTNAFELYPENFDAIVERIADETKKEIFKRAAHISSVFSGIEYFDEQVTLLKDLTNDDKDFFNISDSDMESFFNNETQTVSSAIVKAGKDAEGAKTWKDIVKHKPNVVFSKATDVSSGYFKRSDDINNRKKFFQLAYYSKNILGPMTLLARLSNRTKAILSNPTSNGHPNEVSNDCKSVDAQTSASSYFDFHNNEDVEYIDYIGNSQMSDLTDYDYDYDFSEDEYIPGAANDENEGEKKGGSKKKSKNTSQKKGGFLKGILKKITTCDCDKKVKRKDNKTRRRGGKKFTVRKNKKSGGKHTYRKKKGSKKQKRVRFTIKN